MALTRRDPFKDLLFLQERMSRIFDEALLKYKGCASLAAGGAWYPPVDIYETEDNVILKAELPGVETKSVSIEVNENTLMLKGERKLEKNLSEENYHRMERFYGTFQRVFSLPYTVDKAGITANFKDGVLQIMVPKARDLRRESIKVKIQ
ncbi:MAG: Hsp20/alpha crystallin family protein [Deltaproteobacteria bacterium]|nr:Hsp20/alpha crystallin family protein [Deltaproteobacteria bacterium]